MNDRNNIENQIQDALGSEGSRDFEIIFDNGGGATLQVGFFDDYVHHYDDMAQLAQDVAALVGGTDVSDWEGNEPECLITDDEYFKHSPNGGYTALDQDNYLDADNAESGWNNVRHFAEAIQALQTA